MLFGAYLSPLSYLYRWLVLLSRSCPFPIFSIGSRLCFLCSCRSLCFFRGCRPTEFQFWAISIGRNRLRKDRRCSSGRVSCSRGSSSAKGHTFPVFAEGKWTRHCLCLREPSLFRLVHFSLLSVPSTFLSFLCFFDRQMLLVFVRVYWLSNRRRAVPLLVLFVVAAAAVVLISTSSPWNSH